MMCAGVDLALTVRELMQEPGALRHDEARHHEHAYEGEHHQGDVGRRSKPRSDHLNNQLIE